MKRQKGIEIKNFNRFRYLTVKIYLNFNGLLKFEI